MEIQSASLKESKELPRVWVRGLIGKHLKPQGRISAHPLRTNNYQRHKNWKITISGTPPHARSSEAQPRAKEEKISYLLRVENSFTNKVRRMFLKDEIAVLKLLQPYRVAPRLITHGRYRGRLFLIEEWMRAKPFSLPARPTHKDFKKIIEFIVRVNRIPFNRVGDPQTGGFRFKDDCLDRLAARKNDFDSRIRRGRNIKEFLPVIKAITPLYKKGFAELARRVRALPKSVWRHLVLSYRDISRDNIFMAKPHYLAVDWEWHSVGIADPSLSLVVLMQRLRLMRYRAHIVNAYLRPVRGRLPRGGRSRALGRAASNGASRRKTPHLEKLIDARILERLLGGLTWSLGWIANMKRAGVPSPILARAVKSGVKDIKRHKRELEEFLHKKR